jgi:uncharacterized membrane protein
MEALLKEFAAGIALCAELAGIAIVAIGALEALVGTMRTIVPSPNLHSRKKEVWRRFGTWLLLGLEFELAADIVRSAIAPTWIEIGELGAIAVIRTFLNYFLEKDLEHAADSERSEAAALQGGSTRLGEAA